MSAAPAEVLDNRPPLPQTIKTGNGAAPLVASWAYRDAAGEVLGYVARYQIDDHPKEIRPFFKPTKSGGWSQGAAPTPRPLYGLDLLAARPDAPVLICEGEKSADAAGVLAPDWVAISAPGGASAAGSADLEPLTDRTVTIWPDNDEPGTGFAADLAHRLDALGCAVALLDPLALDHEAPPKWDAADALASGLDPVLLADALRDAEIWGADEREPKPEPAPAPRPYFFRVRPDLTVQDGKGRADELTGWPGLWHVGVVKIEVEGVDTLQYAHPLRICQYFENLATLDDGTGAGHCDALAFTDRHDHRHQWVMPREILAGVRSELYGALLSQGFEMSHITTVRGMLPEFLQSFAKAERRGIAATKTGWLAPDLFVLPDGALGDPDKAASVFWTGSDEHPHHTGGTLDAWRDGVAKPCESFPLLAFLLSASFAAPLLKVAGQDSGGFHLVGSSSTGKSTALLVAGSVWGPPKDYRASWEATPTAFELLAELRNDAPLILDELGQADARDVGHKIYLLANETGKGRGNAAVKMRKTKQWRSLFISAGEKTLSQKMAEAGLTPPAGLEVRLLHLPADLGNGAGILTGQSNAGARRDLITSLQGAVMRHHGHPAREFLQRLADDLGKDPAEGLRITEQVQGIARALAGSDSGQVQRAASRFALVALAGEMATRYGVTGWAVGSALSAVKTLWAEWRREWGGGNRDADLFLQRAREWLTANRFRLVTVDAEGKALNPTYERPAPCFGYYRAEGSAPAYLLNPAGWADLLIGTAHKVALDALRCAGLLGDTVKDGTGAPRLYIEGQRLRLWPIRATETEGGDDGD
jgi:uncharacterized protein (DUF927 family)